MTTFVNQRVDSAIRTAEFSAASGLNYSFIHLAPGADVAPLTQWLASRDMAQEIISETNHGDHTLLIVRGKLTPDTLKQKFINHGEQLASPAPEAQPFQPWKWRGIASIFGQGLQLASVFIPKKGVQKKATKGLSDDQWATLGFAVSNMLANISNIIFGAQEKEDPHHLRALKSELNVKFAPDVLPGKALASADSKLVSRRDKSQPHYTIGEQIYNFAQRYSVSFGEVGLRLLGTFSLIFSVGKFRTAVPELMKTKSLTNFYKATNHSDNPVTRKIGLFWLAGKMVAMLSKEPDPYNPTPPTALDNFREKYSFRISSLMEMSASGMQAQNKFSRGDKVGGAGSSIFVGGFGVRLFAPFGSREVNMKELNAHITDSLSKMPEDRIPQVLAETVVQLKQHFADKKLNISELYTQIAGDLETYHHIHLKPLAVSAAAPEQPALNHAPAEKHVPLHAVSPAQMTHHGRIEADKQAALSA